MPQPPDPLVPRDPALPVPVPDFRALFRRLERALVRIEHAENDSQTLEVSLRVLLEEFREELGFEGGRIYQRDAAGFFLCCGFGTSCDAPVGLRIPAGYPPHLRTIEKGVAIGRQDERGADEEFERRVGVSARYAAIAVGDGPSHVIAFSFRGDFEEERVLYSLTAVRHAINLKLAQRQFSGILEESRLIQEGMLPDGAPALDGFDVAGRSCPAETVGGDLFDFLPLPSGRMGIALADSSGHGVPAALLARDAITGLRMGAGDGRSPAEIVGHLNDIIHRAALARKFVSLFFGVLAPDGALDYCNAGHTPPLLAKSASVVPLEVGGPVLGPIPGIPFTGHLVRLERGDRLVLFTDGLVERRNPIGEMFGAERLAALLPRLGARTAASTIDAILGEADTFGASVPADDDVTVVVVRRL